jgi:uncharacterized protein
MTFAMQKRWYREPWPWLLMIMPAVAVIGGIVTIWLSAITADGLVTDDYYKQGMAINRELARDEKAKSLGLAAKLSMDDQNIAIVLHGATENMPAALLLGFSHPTRSGQDQRIRLQNRGMGHYIGRVDQLKPGKWRLILEDPEGGWRLAGQVQMPLSKAYIMEANK